MSLTFSPGNHQYRMDGKLVRSVTGLIDAGLKKDALIKWSANFVAQIVADDYYDRRPESREQLYEDLAEAAERGALYDFLRRAPERYKEEKGVTGSRVHEVAECLVNGTPVQIPDEVRGYAEGYARWLDRWHVTPIMTERSVASRTYQYAGRVDCIARVGVLNDITACLDWKTSNRVYSSTALQTSAYARADFCVTDDDPKTELPIPECQVCIVVHITPEGTTASYLCRDPKEIDEAFADFLLVAKVAKRMHRIEGRWSSKTGRAEGGYLGEPIELPSRWL